MESTEKTEQKYYTTIGLEIHAGLATNTKMFCRCQNNPFAAEPNANICPVCMAHPGALPVPNKAAIEHMINIGLALGGEIANFTEFDRKNYFYPDIPKGYQISQLDYPIVSEGRLAGVDITRVHLEEDTATSKHHSQHSLVDYNRAGVPLSELVTEPVMHSPQDAVNFAREYQILLRFLGASHANIEKGEMRVELNISISPDKDVLGTKVEVKNIGSISAVGRAAEFEIERMTALWEAGKQDEIMQETRGWDAEKGRTFSQRKKENSADYRYFPEPDIPKFYLHDLYNLEELKSELPELPWEMRTRYVDELGVRSDIAEVFVNDHDLAVFFENTNILFDQDKALISLAANYLTSDLVGYMKNEEGGRQLLKNLQSEDFAKLIKMAHANEINSRGAKDILLILAIEGGDPQKIAKDKGLVQQNDPGAIKGIAQEVIDENPTVVVEFKAGKEASIKFLIGQGMKKSKGSANPKMLDDLFRELLA